MSAPQDHALSPSDSDVRSSDDPSPLTKVTDIFYNRLEHVGPATDLEHWIHQSTDELIQAMEICTLYGWFHVRQALIDLARVLHSYHQAGRTLDCLEFLKESRHGFETMTGDIILGKIHEGMTLRWKILLKDILAEMEKEGIPLIEDGDENDAPEENIEVALEEEQESATAVDSFEEEEEDTAEQLSEETEEEALEESEEAFFEDRVEEETPEMESLEAEKETPVEEEAPAAASMEVEEETSQDNLIPFTLPPLSEDFFSETVEEAPASDENMFPFPNSEEAQSDAIAFEEEEPVDEAVDETPDHQEEEESLFEDTESEVEEEDAGQFEDEDLFAQEQTEDPEEEETSSYEEESFDDAPVEEESFDDISTEEALVDEISDDEESDDSIAEEEEESFDTTSSEENAEEDVTPEEELDDLQILESLQASMSRGDVQRAREAALMLTRAMEKHTYEESRKAVEQAEQRLTDNAKAIEEAVQQVKQAGEDLAQMEKQLTAREEECANTRETIAQIDSEVSNIITDLDELDKQIAALKAERAARNETLEATNQRRAEAIAEESRLKTEVDSLSEEVENIHLFVDDLQADQKHRETERKLLENELAEAQEVMEHNRSLLMNVEDILTANQKRPLPKGQEPEKL